MNINICERCGGNKSMVIDYTVATPYPTACTVTSGAPLAVNLGFPFTVSAAAPAQWATTTPCTCSPEPKHDGKLDEDDDGCTVSFDDNAHLDKGYGCCRGVRIAGKYAIGNGEDEVTLSPKKALSLLAWLEQERETLEQLAKEQGNLV